MSKAPSMPVFTDALIGDTTHLSIEEFGAYCMILMVTWRNNGQPLPDDDNRMARICRVSVKRWSERLRPVLSGFFDLTGGVWRQGRLEKEWNYVQKTSRVRSVVGKLGAEAKALKAQQSAQANAEPEVKQTASTHTHTQEELTIEADASMVAPKAASPVETAKAMACIWREELTGFVPVPEKLTQARVASLNRRLKDSFGKDLEQWRAYCRRIRGSPYLCGENNKGWKADIDFALTPKQVNKILEGSYDDRKPAAQQRTVQPRSAVRSFTVDDDAGLGGLFDAVVGEMDACGAGAGYRAH